VPRDPEGRQTRGARAALFLDGLGRGQLQFNQPRQQAHRQPVKGRPADGVRELRDPVSAGLPDHGPGPGDHGRDDHLHAQARRQGDPRLSRCAGPEAAQAGRAGRAQGERRPVMIEWFFATLKQYPEIAIFLALGLGYYFGSFTFKGIGLGSVPATLLAAVIIGQIGIPISTPLKATVFLMFLFAVGYGVGPQFVRGVAKDGLPQAIFSVVQCAFCLVVPYAVAKFVGYDLGYAAGLFAGSQPISASMGLPTDAINRLGLPAEQSKALLDSMPIAYAVSYIFGTVGSAIVIALVGPVLMRVDLVKACKEYEEKYGGTKEMGGAGSAWHRWVLRAFRVQAGGKAVGLRVAEAEAMVPDARVFVLRLRRGGTIEEATADTVLRADELVAVAGPREVLVRMVGDGAKEIDDPELLNVPV